MKQKINYHKEVAKLLEEKPVKISCVVPIYNEGVRIPAVLDVLVKYQFFEEIILVNDGSTDGTQIVCENYVGKYKKIKLATNEVNLGKTKAVEKGIDKSLGELIVLMDADLKGLENIYIDKMIYFVLNHDFDMTILDRGGDRLSVLSPIQSWFSRLLGGERAFYKKDFQNVIFPKNSRYAIEHAINLYFINNGKKVRTIYCPNLMCTYQFQKKGFIKGLNVYIKMFFEMYRVAKIKGYYIQVRDVVEDRIEPLYKFYRKTKYKKVAVSTIILSGLVLSTLTFIKLFSKLVVVKGQKELKFPYKQYDL